MPDPPLDCLELQTLSTSMHQHLTRTTSPKSNVLYTFLCSAALLSPSVLLVRHASRSGFAAGHGAHISWVAAVANKKVGSNAQTGYVTVN